MLRKKSISFTTQLLDSIRLRRDNEAESMLNEDLAKMTYRSVTLLHYAAFYGNEMIARHLIKIGSEIDPILKGSLKTPLMIAIEQRRTAVVKVLLDANANINAMKDGGNTALQIAFDPQYFNSQIIEVFLRRLQTKARSVKQLVGLLLHTGCSPFHVTYLRDIEVMNCMLERGFDISTRGPRQLTALHAAVEVNDLKLAKWLMDKGADVNAVDEDNKSPLFMAASHGRTEMVQFLLDRGAIPKIQDFKF